MAWCAALGAAGGVGGYALEAGPLVDFPQIANPYGVDSPIVGIVGVTASIVAAGCMVAETLQPACASVWLRPASNRSVERLADR